MEKKYFSMDKNVCFGLCYMIWFFAVILLATDKELDIEEKRMCVDSFIIPFLSTILLPFCGLGIVFYIFWLIAIIKRFSGDFTWKVPIVSKISEAIIK